MIQEILVVDDSVLDRKLVWQLLSKSGYVVHLADSASRALEIVDRVRPALVLLDVMMPEISGLHVLGEIRKRYSVLEMPVIMITANAESEDVVAALRMGANDYITKPIDLAVTLRRAQNHIQTSALAKVAAKLKESEAICAMITTYNHEINNPLAAAILTLERLSESHPGDPLFDKLESALYRITNIVKKIDEVAKRQVVEYTPYVGDSKMVKI